MDLLGGGVDEPVEITSIEPVKQPVVGNQDLLDLLGLFFFLLLETSKKTSFFFFLGGLDLSSNTEASLTIQNNNHINSSGLGLVDSPIVDTSLNSLSNSVTANDASLTVYDKNELTIVFNLERATDALDTLLVYVIANNASPISTITDFLFEVRLGGPGRGGWSVKNKIYVLDPPLLSSSKDFSFGNFFLIFFYLIFFDFLKYVFFY